MKRWKQGLAWLLTASMVAGNSLPVLADSFSSGIWQETTAGSEAESNLKATASVPADDTDEGEKPSVTATSSVADPDTVWSVRYEVLPEADAAKVKVADEIKNGKDLDIKVTPQKGWTIGEVTANGVELEGEEKSSFFGLGATSYVYTVEDVDFDVDVEVYMKEEIPVTMKLSRLSLNSSEMIPVVIDGVEGGEQQDEIEVGIVKEHAPTIEGYEFVKATVGNDEVEEIGTWTSSDGKTYIYYTTTKSGNTAMLLEDGDTLVLHYQIPAVKYSVTYSYDNKSVKVEEGVKKVPEGGSYTFTAQALASGKKLVVTVNGNEVQPKATDETTGKETYLIENVQEEQQVEVRVKEVEGYSFTYNNSDIRQGEVVEVQSGSRIPAGDTLSFILRSDKARGVRTKDWHLNLLAINGEYVEVPQTFEIGAEVTSTLSTGETVNIKLVKKPYYEYIWDKYDYYDYEVVIQPVYHDIEITDGNFKDGGRNEIIIKELSGVKDIEGWDADEKAFRLDGINGVFKQEEKTGNEFYFNLQPGYTNPKLVIRSSGEEKDIEVNRNQGNLPDGREPQYTYEQYHWRFDVPSGLGDNVEIFITSDIMKYQLEYQVNGKISTEITDANTYSILEGSNLITVQAEEPSADGYVFGGWSYLGQTYQPNDVFTLTSVLAEGASDDGKIVLDAVLTPLGESEQVNYKIAVYLQKADGTYPEIANDEISKHGSQNSTVILAKSLPEQQGYQVDEVKSELVHENLQEGDTIKVYYARDAKAYSNIKFESEDSSKGSLQGVTSWLTLDSSEIIVPSVQANEDYVFSGWKCQDTLVGRDDIDWSKISLEAGKTVVLIATFEPLKKYFLTYNDNGGVGGPETNEERYAKGDEVILNKQTVPSYEKHAFLGWSETQHEVYTEAAPEEGVLVSKVTFGEADKTVYAVWAKDENGDGTPDYENAGYVVKYDGNGGSGNQAAESGKLSTEAETPVSLAATTTFTKEKSVFLGWSEGAQGEVTTAEAYEAVKEKLLSTVTFEAGSEPAEKTVYAVWAKDTDGDGTPDYEEEKYVLSYDANGGEGGPEASGKVYVNGQVVTLEQENVPSYGQHKFLGWSETQHEVYAEAAPEEGVVVSTVTFGESDKTVYAVWATDENGDQIPDYENAGYVVKYEGNGGSGSQEAESGKLSVTASTEVTLVATTTFTKENAIFLGWSEEAQEEVTTAEAYAAVQEKLRTMVTFDAGSEPVVKTMYAVWAADKNNDNHPDATQKATITFNSEHGFNGDAEMKELVLNDLLPGTIIEVPTPVDTDTDNIVFVGWAPALPEDGKVPASETAQNYIYTAVYAEDKNNDGKDDSQQALRKLTFNTGDKGAFEDGSTSIERYVVAGESIYPEVPKVRATVSDTHFSRWTPSYSAGQLVPADAVDTVYTAVYGSKAVNDQDYTAGSANSYTSGGVDGRWVHVSPDDPFVEISESSVPQNSDPLTSPEWHRWKFVLNNGTMLFNKKAHIRNPYAQAGQPSDGWFFFDNNGIMQYGWYKDAENKWYYLYAKSDGMLGTRLEGWHYDEQDGKWYYLQPGSGEMQLGWKQIGDKWYYFNPIAPEQTWVYDEVLGVWMYNGSTSRPYGSMFQNEMTPDGYQVGADGAWVK